MVKQYGQLSLEARKELLQAEEGNASNVARELLCAASGKSAADILAGRELYASEEIAERLHEFVARRLKGEPLAYILGQWDFYGMRLHITPDVLIPRDDTEVVTEMAIETALFLNQNPRILDLCAGSGCIGLAIGKRVKDARITLGDVSPAALKVAKQNVAEQKLTGRVNCLQIDVRKPAPKFLGEFDLIVSNPPYINSKELTTLDASVKDFEPHVALDGGEDGLAFYRAILDNYTVALKSGGFFCFEFGIHQEDAVCALLEKHQFRNIKTRKDTGNIIRAVVAQKK